MFQPEEVRAIVASGALRVVRRALFTGTKGAGEEANRFHLEAFYQHGTAVVLQSQGTVYLLTPSHVVRNATINDYKNDSPVWASVRHQQPREIHEFLMPTRFYDLSPNGETALDAAILEINPVIVGGVPDYLDWDDEELFCHDNDVVDGVTAVVVGYPEQTNDYEFQDQDDGSVRQMANIRMAGFRGMVSSKSEEDLAFVNFEHQSGFQYSGLSGGVVVCVVRGRPRYLGIAVSRGGDGRRFKVLRFADIRRALGDLRQVPWEVLDEAYFLGHPTHSMMTFRDFSEAFSKGKKFVPQRSNVFLEQLTRTMSAPKRAHWVCDFQQMHVLLKSRLRYELLDCLRALAAMRT